MKGGASLRTTPVPAAGDSPGQLWPLRQPRPIDLGDGPHSGRQKNALSEMQRSAISRAPQGTMPLREDHGRGVRISLLQLRLCRRGTEA